MAELNKNFIINLKGKEFVTYEGLLDLAHQKGLISIETAMIEFVSDGINDTVIVKAIAKTKDKEFHGIGDASPRSVNKMIEPHMIRMAETRAKARALRDLTNIGMTAFEELTGIEDVEEGPKQSKPTAKPKAKNKGLSDGQIKRLYAIGYSRDVDAEAINKSITTQYKKDSARDLTKAEYDELCSRLEALPEKE